MNTEKLTIHRALSELKLIDAKIAKQIQAFEPVGVRLKDKPINNIHDPETFKQNVQSSYDSIVSLINRKNKIKSAIVASNAKTKVKIGDQEITVADAISMKEVVGYKKNLRDCLDIKLRGAMSSINKNNDVVSQNCQKILEVTYGKDHTQVRKEDLENIQKPYMDNNSFQLFDPIKAEEKSKALSTEIDQFELNIDAALSESNAITFIEI